MRPAAFDYVRPGTLSEAVEALRTGGPDAQILAGGQFLVTVMRARLARPSLLVDFSDLDELRFIRVDGDHCVVGAMTTIAELESSDLVRTRCPALAEAAGSIGDPQVRNRATVGGNLLLLEPTSDLAPVVLASRGTLVILSGSEQNEVAADEFFGRPLGEALRPGEVITEVRFGRLGAGSAFEKLSRRAADQALASAAAFVQLDGGSVRDIGLAMGGVHRHSVNLSAVEERLRGVPFDAATAEEALQELSRSLEPPSDVHANADYRRMVAPVVAVRALVRAVDRSMRR